MKMLWAACLAAVLLWVNSAHAQITTYTVTMSGPNESPPNASPGIGSGTIVYDSVLHTMSYNINFSGLIGNTTNAHVHAATPTPFSGVAGVATSTPSFAGFPSGVTSGSFINTFDLTLATSWNATYITANGGSPGTAETAFISAINNGQAYFNIHSSSFGGGEIRGFLVAVPEPSTVMLMSVVGIGAAAFALRKKLFKRAVRFARAK